MQDFVAAGLRLEIADKVCYSRNTILRKEQIYIILSAKYSFAPSSVDVASNIIIHVVLIQVPPH